VRKAISAAAATAFIAGSVGAVAATTGVEDDTRRCVVNAHAETLVANADARVYEVFKGFSNHANAFRTGIYACRYKTGRKFLLGTTWETADENLPNDRIRYIRSITLSRARGNAPPRVAFVDTNCVGHPCRNHVVVRKLSSTGDVLSREKAGGPFDQLSLGFADGGGPSLAWLESSADGSCAAGCRVHLLQRSRDRVLDQGTDIDPGVFGAVNTERPGRVCCLDGEQVFVWKRGDVLKSAHFAD
jgi:hypothetical protein